MECGLARRDGDKRGREGRGEDGETREESKTLRKKQIRPLYSSPFSMILLSNHGYKGNKKHRH